MNRNGIEWNSQENERNEKMRRESLTFDNLIYKSLQKCIEIIKEKISFLGVHWPIFRRL